MKKVERWDIYEIELSGLGEGNPFLDVEVSAEVSLGHRTVRVGGFYDGDDRYRIRFMPDTEGSWSYSVRSNIASLNGAKGAFACVHPGLDNHGPVRVSSSTRFAYSDGTCYQPIGTTCYAWNHQGDALEEMTLNALRSAPFNKIRMCVFPKHYAFNANDPEYYPFEGTPAVEGKEASWSFDRFAPAFFRHLESRIDDLRRLGIEADLILFHPYDRWGFSRMAPHVDDRYLEYIVARLSAYRNVWWSFANEYDLMKEKSETDWDRFFRIVQQHDPYQHLRSIHNCRSFYDHGKPWVTHCSVQHHELDRVDEWIDAYRKPVVVDECGYEGDIHHDWGNLTAEELVCRIWTGFSLGGYVGHGETYAHPNDMLWWSKGGTLHGQSLERIAFLRQIFAEAPPGGYARIGGRGAAEIEAPKGYIAYYGVRQPRYKEYRLPEAARYTAEVIDTWEMSMASVDGEFSGSCRIELPAKPYVAVRFTAVDSQ